MTKARVGLALLALLLPFLLHATHFIKNDLLNTQASKMIEDIGNELFTKTGINAYAIATNEHFPEAFNLVQYSKEYESNMSKPFVVLIFAPNALITAQSQERGRVGLITSSDDLKKLYSAEDVKDATIDVVASKDKNTNQDKYAIGVVQGYSELADQIARSRGAQMKTTLPNDTREIIGYMQYLVFFGSIFVLWIFLIRPIYMRIKNGKQK